MSVDPTGRDEAETLAHIEELQRRRIRVAAQLRVARERVAELEREYWEAVDADELARDNYQRAAARPLIEP